jgi:predicted TIM-barrel fold metal-dependent hydrolase
MFMSNARIISNLCLSDIFDRYPNLKIMSAESGIGWVPFVLEALEYHFDDMVTDDRERHFAQRRPKEYFTDHIYATFWFERLAPSKLLTDVGVHNVMVETDFPHPTCLYPRTREYLAGSVAELDPYARQRVLRDNAVELYGIDATLTDVSHSPN